MILDCAIIGGGPAGLARTGAAIDARPAAGEKRLVAPAGGGQCRRLRPHAVSRRGPAAGRARLVGEALRRED